MGRKSRRNASATPPPLFAAAVSSSLQPDAPVWTGLEWKLIGLLIALNLLVFSQLGSHSFLNYDDGQFIYENEAVRQGLSPSSIQWALSSASIGWYPATWLSHMLDVSLFGLRPAGHFLTGLLFHTGSTCLLFAALTLMTRSPLRSLMVAALFAIHPMHVESVAWASERKDTLSTFFAMLALLGYSRWADRRAMRDRVLLFVALLLSIMAKQMLVTLPLVFVLLDYWPLQRIPSSALRLGNLLPLLREKLLLFALTIVGCIAAVVGQRNLQAVQSIEVITPGLRIANALVAYVRYLGKFFWPTDMAVLYPFVPIGPGPAVAAAIFLLAITIAVIALRGRAPYLPGGWFWFLGTLVPVIGIVQIGPQAMADRYTYFPYVGLFIALVWGIADLALHSSVPRHFTTALSVAVVGLLALLAWRQTRYWKNSETLFTHTLAITGANPLADYSLGQALQLTNPDRAIPHLERSIALADDSQHQYSAAALPDWYPQAHVAMGTALLMKARAGNKVAERLRLIDAATLHLREALKVQSDAPHARNNLAVAAKMREQVQMVVPSGTDEVTRQYNAFLNNGAALSRQGHLPEAIAQFRKAAELAPRSPEARIYLALGLLKANQIAAGVRELREAQKLDPVAADEYVTKALQLPAGPNLQRLIDQFSAAL